MGLFLYVLNRHFRYVYHVLEPVVLKLDPPKMARYHQTALLDIRPTHFPENAESGTRLSIIPLPLYEYPLRRSDTKGVTIVVCRKERLGVANEVEKFLNTGFPSSFRIGKAIP